MKTHNLFLKQNVFKKSWLAFGLLAMLFASKSTFAFPATANAQSKTHITVNDSVYIKAALVQLSPRLNYPNLVQEFYNMRNFSIAWVRPDTVK